MSKALGMVIVAALVGAEPMVAQVGLGSNVAQVALRVRVAPRASIQGVGPTVRSSSEGFLTEASVKVRLSTNTGYRLVAVGCPRAAPRGCGSARRPATFRSWFRVRQ